MYHNLFEVDCQDQTALAWSCRKRLSLLLADVYRAIGWRSKADRIEQCGTQLCFALLENGGRKLMHGNFCRVRLCPTCQWRRGLKLFGQVQECLKWLAPRNYKFLFLTLTVRNVAGDDLSSCIDDLMQGWQRLTQLSKFKKAVKGAVRTMEVTHNLDRNSPSFDTYHPHFHVLLAVNSSYAKGTSYIKKSEWADMWASSMRLDYFPQVDIRATYGEGGNPADALAELCKYTAKSADYLIQGDLNLSAETIRILDDALANRRFVAFTGAFKEAKKALNLPDHEEDLTDTSGNTPENTAAVVWYEWSYGYKQYKPFTE